MTPLITSIALMPTTFLLGRLAGWGLVKAYAMVAR